MSQTPVTRQQILDMVACQEFTDEEILDEIFAKRKELDPNAVAFEEAVADLRNKKK